MSDADPFPDPKNVNLARTHRGTCTDKTWKSGNCPRHCLGMLFAIRQRYTLRAIRLTTSQTSTTTERMCTAAIRQTRNRTAASTTVNATADLRRSRLTKHQQMSILSQLLATRTSHLKHSHQRLLPRQRPAHKAQLLQLQTEYLVQR